MINNNTSIINNIDITKYINDYFNSEYNKDNDRPPVGGVDGAGMDNTILLRGVLHDVHIDMYIYILYINIIILYIIYKNKVVLKL